MKLKYILPIAALLCGTIFTSCVKDLEVENINPQQVSEFNEDYIFNKIYGNLVLTGQSGPVGNSDLDTDDEGMSNMMRLVLYFNEVPTDECHCWWDDPGMKELNRDTWTNTNSFVISMYYRLMFGVTMCNFYLDNANGGDAATKQKRAEARFMRALHYYYLMDFFANPPFLTHLSSENAPQIQRADLFNFIESELKAVIGEGGSDEVLADARTIKYGRADKAAGYLLLARLYLNAEVYTGTARWSEAKNYADKTIGTSYELCSTPMNGFSAYQLLFMGDNDTNGAQNEIILPALQDGYYTQSYGGCQFTVCCSMSEAMRQEDLYGVKDKNGNPILGYGSNDQWNRGMRARKEFSLLFFGKNATENNIPQGKPMDVTPKVGDDRAIFYTNGQKLSIVTEGEAGKSEGLLYIKYNNLHADGSDIHDPALTFVDTDFPVLRLGEAYMISAECDARLNDGKCTSAGLERIKDLRRRANVKTGNMYDGKNADALTEFTLEDIFQEWSREFGYEGQRRMVLIRWNRFGGQSDYKWEWMGGTQAGNQFDKRYNIFPIPATDLNANPNLKPNYK